MRPAAHRPETAAALAKLPLTSAYFGGELRGVPADGVMSLELMQQASGGGSGALVYFAFDLLEPDGAPTARLTLLERKQRLAKILKEARAGPLGWTIRRRVFDGTIDFHV